MNQRKLRQQERQLFQQLSEYIKTFSPKDQRLIKSMNKNLKRIWYPSYLMLSNLYPGKIVEVGDGCGGLYFTIENGLAIITKASSHCYPAYMSIATDDKPVTVCIEELHRVIQNYASQYCKESVIDNTLRNPNFPNI